MLAESSKMLKAVIILASARPVVSSWVGAPCSRALRVSSPPRLEATANPSESEGWPQLQEMLDKLPVFTVANEGGQPLQYQVDGKPLAIFYADVEAGKSQLAIEQEKYPDLGCDLIPVGLGNAYKLSCDGKGMVVPGIGELQACGAPEGAQPMGQELPLFACMQMSRDGDAGPVLPLFMSNADCTIAVAAANEAAQPETPLEVTALSLQSVVEQLSAEGGPTADTFSFIAPQASLDHQGSYLGKGIYWREVENAEDAEE